MRALQGVRLWDPGFLTVQSPALICRHLPWVVATSHPACPAPVWAQPCSPLKGYSRLLVVHNETE